MSKSHHVPRRFVPTVAALTAGLALYATPALASNARVEGSTLKIDAAAGEINSLTVSRDAQFFYVHDADGSDVQPGTFDPLSPVPVFPGPGCAPNGANEVKCAADGVTAIAATIGDGADY